MLSRIELTGAPSFSSGSCSLDGLGRFNFVFGPNGTGKTTISRVVANPGRFAGAGVAQADGNARVETAVYNRDYVSTTLREADRLAGVFTLDDEDPDARREYDELTREGGIIAVLTASRDRHQADLNAIEAQIGEARTQLLVAGWAARELLPAEIAPMLDGYRGVKAKFIDKLVSVERTAPPKLEDLLLEARSVFDASGSTITPLRSLEVPQLSNDDALPELLATPVVGSTDVTLAQLISGIGNQDWVSAGRAFLPDSEGKCPFCQQDLPVDFLRHLAEYFDDEFARKITRLQEEQSAMGRMLGDARDRLLAFEALDSSVVAERRDSAIAAVRRSFDAIDSAVSSKVLKPSSVIQIEDPEPNVRAVNELIGDANKWVAEHNARIRSRDAARTALLSRCWSYFAWDVLAAEMGKYVGLVDGTRKRKQDLLTQLSDVDAQLRGKTDRAAEIEAGLVSTAPAIRRVNQILQSVGFRRFRLASSLEVKDGYMLERDDGSTVVEDTLSDGERTFIAFLYFFVQLESRHRQFESRSLVAVIDDPISSLDSDVLFVVGSLVRRLLRLVHDQSGALRQVIVLTHNVQFHLEVTYPRAQDKAEGLLAGRRFYELKRLPDGSTNVHASGAENTVKSNYQSLWSVVREASETDDVSGAGLENVLRRILENYFTVIGTHPNLDALMESVSGDDALVTRSLLAWMHHGSHTFVDNLEYSPSGISKVVYLAVFRKIFSETGQIGHYDMMMSVE
ncbi:AAA family ATPase [uncultured Schumannella sp.]|uniref:AAA family ATPase n=1 Tax=uncultured Schumannella sp. TaxID=1195956 RepID=UPI0025FC9D25|nr:AAA family ATPase [uncultured Schumannella sp.]